MRRLTRKDVGIGSMRTTVPLLRLLRRPAARLIRNWRVARCSAFDVDLVVVGRRSEGSCAA